VDLTQGVASSKQLAQGDLISSPGSKSNDKNVKLYKDADKLTIQKLRVSKELYLFCDFSSSDLNNISLGEIN
jgi:hypothetical protein